MDKLKTSYEAVKLIKDADTVVIGGSGGGVTEPSALIIALRDRFLKEEHPRDLTIVHTTGLGDREKSGTGYLAQEGLIKREIGGHYGMAPLMAKMVLDNKIEAYNFPQGVIAQLYREIAAKRPGVITHVGIGTYVDSRLGGGKLNARTTEDLVEVVNLNRREWLFYKSFPINVALLRGTTADEKGNVSMEQEPAVLEALAMAQAAHNCSGKVIVQVRRLATKGTLDARLVRIPGILVDVVTVEKDQWQVCTRRHDPSLSGEVKVPLGEIPKVPLNERKIIARRAAMELPPDSIINLGVGMPDGVASVVAEEEISDYVTLTIEQGIIGGIPQGGVIFGCAANPEAIIDQPSEFDFYDGGGLDVAFLGFAQVDYEGNVNSSRFAGSLAGCGGFIDISQNAKKVVFCGTLTTGGLKVRIEQGKLRIAQEGRYKKFLKQVEEITFSGVTAQKKKQKVYYVTERAVFELTPKDLYLLEIAPGIDLEKDVLDQMGFELGIAKPIKIMDSKIFEEEKMGLGQGFKSGEKNATI